MCSIALREYLWLSCIYLFIIRSVPLAVKRTAAVVTGNAHTPQLQPYGYYTISEQAARFMTQINL
jgi:hypothetical protein